MFFCRKYCQIRFNIKFYRCINITAKSIELVKITSADDISNCRRFLLAGKVFVIHVSEFVFNNLLKLVDHREHLFNEFKSPLIRSLLKRKLVNREFVLILVKFKSVNNE